MFMNDFDFYSLLFFYFLLHMLEVPALHFIYNRCLCTYKEGQEMCVRHFLSINYLQNLFKKKVCMACLQNIIIRGGML